MPASALRYRRTGSLQVVTADEPVDRLEQIAEDARGAGLDCELLDAHAAREAEPQLTPDVTAALLVKTHGFVAATDLPARLRPLPSSTARASAFLPAPDASNLEESTSRFTSRTTPPSRRATSSSLREAGRGRSTSTACRRCR